MTRNNAREIAVHLVFALGFGSRSAEEVLEGELNRERFAALGEENPLYAQYPNEKQREYIRSLVEGVYAHGEELDGYISRYAVGWALSRIPRMARAVLRTAMGHSSRTGASSACSFDGSSSLPPSSVRTKDPRIPLTKEATSWGSYCLVSSTAASMAAALGTSGM